MLLEWPPSLSTGWNKERPKKSQEKRKKVRRPGKKERKMRSLRTKKGSRTGSYVRGRNELVGQVGLGH